MKKISLTRLIIILIDIIAIIAMVAVYMINKNKNNTTDIEYNQTFKEFKYTIPENITNYISDTNNLMLETNEWKAKIDIDKDSNDIIMGNANQTKQNLSINYDIISGEEIIITTVNTLLFECQKKDTGENKVIAYFRSSTFPFIYEVVIQNNDGSFNTEALETVIPILMKGHHDE